MAYYRVKNLRGTGDNFPRNSATWIEHWEKHAGKRAGYCHASDCLEFGRDGLVGAHVQLCDAPNRHQYIVPLCHRCNHRNDEFIVVGPLVPVNENLSVLW